MTLAQLAAKQKRIRFWRDFISENKVNPTLKRHIEKILDAYSKALIECWDSEQLTPEHAHMFRDFERQLEECNEEARMLGQGG